MIDEELRTAAREAVENRDLAAWHRVHAILVKLGAEENQEARRERIDAARSFLGRVLVDEARPSDGTIFKSEDSPAGRKGLRDEAWARSVLEKPVEITRFSQGREHIEVGNVVVALDGAFGLVGWDFTVDRLDLIDVSADSPASSRWRATAFAVGTLRVRLVEGECVRREIGTGDQGFGKAKGEAISMALKSATVDAFKRAAVHLGPATGLLLKVRETQREDALEEWKNPVPGQRPNLTVP